MKTVKLYSGGQLIRTWKASDSASFYNNGTCFFYDAESENLDPVQISGTIIVERAYEEKYGQEE